MPNTPALVGEGMAALTPNSNVTKEETDVVVNVFNSFGKGEVVSENLMDAVTAVSGSSPAYVFMMIEAMADAAVIGGMREVRHIHSPHKQYLEVQRWYLKQANTRVN